MKNLFFLLSSLFLVLSVSDSEALAQGDVTFKGSFNGGYFLLEIAGGKAKISKYPGVYHNNCEICNPNVYPCSTGYDGKRRLGIAGSQCSPLTPPALSAVQKYCTQSCSVNLGDPAPPLPPPPAPPAPPKSNPAPTSTPTPTPKTPSNAYVTFSGSFGGGYIQIKIAAGKANVVMYPGRTYIDCKICEPSIWGCSAGTDGKKRLGTGGSKCTSVPSSAMNSIRAYCAQSCSISSQPPPMPPEEIVIVNNNPENTCGATQIPNDSASSGTDSASSGTCSFCHECSKFRQCRRRGDGPFYGCTHIDAAKLRALGYVCSDFCPSDDSGGSKPVGHPGTDPLPTNPPSPPDSIPNSGGSGTPSDSTGTDTSENEPCMCNGQEVDEAICDLVDEHKEHTFPFKCDQFRNDHGMFVPSGPTIKGTEKGKHKGYGHINPSLKILFANVQNYLIKNHGNIPLRVTSGYRCPKGNHDVYISLNNGKGTDKYPADTPYDVKNQVSRHVIGKAADIGPAVVKDSRWTPEVKNDIVKYNLQLFLDPNDSTGQRSLSQSGIYPTTSHVHIDLPRGLYDRTAR